MSSSTSENHPSIKPADLRGILKYVPLFRGHTFVISIDGSVVDHENFGNILTDIAVLRSLNIGVILAFGIGEPLRQLAQQLNIPLSDIHGEGRTDAKTLELAGQVASKVGFRFLAGLRRNGVDAAISNAVRALHRGIIRGEDQQFSGRFDSCETPVMKAMLAAGVTPVFPPVQVNRNGVPLRLNSDELAAKLAEAFEASKLIYLTSSPGLVIDGETRINIPVEDLERRLETAPESIQPQLLSKAGFCVQALKTGTDRAHVLDGRVFGGLLTEIFDKMGLGTMIHANLYQRIRPAAQDDITAIHSILRSAAKFETVRERTHEEIRCRIDSYYVYEVDGSIIACVALTPLNDHIVELGSMLVLPFYKGRNVGKTLAEFACEEAKRRGFSQIVALTTQASDFFSRVCGFRTGSPADLPQPRADEYRQSCRNSTVFIRDLKQ